MSKLLVMISVNGVTLASHLAGPETDQRRPGLVLCHGFPAQRSMSVAFGETYPELADRLSADSGWRVMSFDFRGTGESDGDFSLRGWLDDLHGAVGFLREQKVTSVFLAGFGTGGSLTILAAAEDPEIAGVTSFGAPAHFDDWANDPQRCLQRAKDSGAIKTEGFPEDFQAWAKQFSEVRPETLIGKIPPRPLMLVHGSADEVVSAEEARLLSDAAGPGAEMRIIGGATHDLRHDPRAVALLSGWMDRNKA